MWVLGATATSICYLIVCLSLTMSEATQLQGLKSSPTFKGSIVSSSHTHQYGERKHMNNIDDGDGDDNPGQAEEHNGSIDDDDNLAFLEKDGVIEANGAPPDPPSKGQCKAGKTNDWKINNELAQASRPRSKYIRHGQKVVLQLRSSSRFWLDCGRKGWKCFLSACPSLYFEGKDYCRCSSAIFQIYRPKPGYIRNGDFVALRNMKTKRWFGCAPRVCVGAPCPGRANYRYGFQYPKKWVHCWGEVFKIYACSKRIGAVITDSDDVALYYPRQKAWVQVVGRKFTKTKCMGSARPPSCSRFEVCHRSTFEIHNI